MGSVMSWAGVLRGIREQAEQAMRTASKQHLP